MKQNNVKTLAIQVAYQNETHLPMKAYWFRAFLVIRNSGVLAFFAWANQASTVFIAPGPHHKFLLSLCRVQTLEELITKGEADMQMSLQIQDAMGIFEQCASGERTDKENFPTAQTWRV